MAPCVCHPCASGSSNPLDRNLKCCSSRTGRTTIPTYLQQHPRSSNVLISSRNALFNKKFNQKLTVRKQTGTNRTRKQEKPGKLEPEKHKANQYQNLYHKELLLEPKHERTQNQDRQINHNRNRNHNKNGIRNRENHNRIRIIAKIKVKVIRVRVGSEQSQIESKYSQSQSIIGDNRVRQSQKRTINRNRTRSKKRNQKQNRSSSFASESVSF